MTATSVAQQDIEFFEQKLAVATDPETKDRLRRQITLLEDARVVYHLNSPKRID